MMTKDAAAEKCYQLLKRAVQAVGAEYCSVGYLANRDGKEHSKFAERVFCYELYHQVMIHWEQEGVPDKAVVHGELAKSAYFKTRLIAAFEGRGTYPDLLFHQPGSMDWNLVVVEVKGSRCRASDLKHDVIKLRAYLTGGRYAIGVLLVVGEDDPRSRVRAALGPSDDGIRVLWKHPSGMAPTVVVGE
jgi:hypothetical protein